MRKPGARGGSQPPKRQTLYINEHDLGNSQVVYSVEI